MKIDACCTIESHATAKKLIGQMDRNQIDMAVIHPSDDVYAWNNEQGNELLLEISREFEGRFISALTVNPWRSDAWHILSRYIRQGCKIVSFSPAVQGLSICDEKFNNLCEKIVKNGMNIPIYFHSGNHSFGAPSQLFLLAKQFPSLNFILGHCGATDYAADVVTVCKSSANIYIEASFARPPGFVAKLNEVGFERGIMGSGYPINNMNCEWLETVKLLPQEHRISVLGGNLLNLLGDSNDH